MDEIGFNWQRHRKVLLVAFILLFVFNVSLYLRQRSEWMGEDNANLIAKEYFVAGQVLNSYKAFLTTLFHPEWPFIVPLTKLQWMVYVRGASLLPENDGEVGVWQNMWFHYHFGKKDRHYFGVKQNRPSPKMVKILDQYWFCLETMATKSFADKEMREKYLEGFAGLAFSYTLSDGFYSGMLLGSAQPMAKIPEMVQRTRLLVQWLNELRTKWKDSAKATRSVQNNPKMLVLSQLTLLINLYDMILGEIHAGKFNCNQSSIHQYVMMKKEFYSPDSGKPAYKKIQNRQERESIYHIAVNSAIARDTKYLIEHYCGFKVVGKIDYAVRLASLKNISPEEQEEFECRSSLREEINIIEDGTNGGRK